MIRLASAIFIFALGACVTSPKNADTFTDAGVVSGSVMTEQTCTFPGSSIWVMVDGQGECVRYFAAGLESATPLVHVWFHGDRMMQSLSDGAAWVPRGWYNNNDPRTLQGYADRDANKYGMLYIRYSRPGVYGSSGDHKERRLKREADIVDTALDALKARHGIERFALTGQSGGGHVVASLLARRNDIVCATITSGAVAVAQRNAIRGWSTDATGYSNFYDPIDHVGDIPADPRRRIFVVGDPRDSNVPFSTQVNYHKALTAAGHQAHLIKADGKGPSRHGLSLAGFRVAKWCVDGVAPEEIQKRIGWSGGASF